MFLLAFSPFLVFNIYFRLTLTSKKKKKITSIESKDQKRKFEIVIVRNNESECVNNYDLYVHNHFQDFAFYWSESPGHSNQ